MRADGSQYVGMQDTEAEALRAEALSGRDLVFVHNHPNGSDASEEDLESAFAAGAELLIVITPQGQEFVYIRGRYGMVKVRDEKASYEVGQVNPEETEELRIRSEAQAWAFQHDSPELIFRQEEPAFQVRVEGEVQFAYSEEAVVLDEGIFGRDTLRASQSLNVVGKSRLNPFVIQVEYEGGTRFWIDLEQYGDTAYDFIGAENLAEIPYAEESGAILDNPFENLVRQTVDIFPIAQSEMTGVLQYGLPKSGPPNCHNYGSLPECAHPGIDYFAPAGTAVRAVTSGEVVGVYVPSSVDYSHVFGPGQDSFRNEGLVYDPRNPLVSVRKTFSDGWLNEHNDRAYVIVRSGNAYVLYAHLDPDSIKVGTHVMKGQAIGTVGRDNPAVNAHLHFEVRTHGEVPPELDDTGEYVDQFGRPQIAVNPLWLHTEGAVDVLEDKFEASMQSFEEQTQALQVGQGRKGRIWEPAGFPVGSVWTGEDLADASAG